MVRALRSFRTRRVVNLAILVGTVAVVVVIVRLADEALRRTEMLTGWFLLALVLALTLFNARKKLPFLPLGNASTWLQVHVYAGLLSLFVFALHVGVGLPNGWLEVMLAVVFLAVGVSGVVGIFISRRFAERLTSRGEHVTYESIPSLRLALRRHVEDLVHDSVKQTGSPVIVDFHAVRLQGFFAAQRNFWRHVLGNERPRQELLRALDAVRRYEDQTGKETLDALERAVREKDDLDSKAALQAMLRYWLFVHVPLTYGMIVVAIAHAVLVTAFSTSARS